MGHVIALSEISVFGLVYLVDNKNINCVLNLASKL